MQFVSGRAHKPSTDYTVAATRWRVQACAFPIRDAPCPGKTQQPRCVHGARGTESVTGWISALGKAGMDNAVGGLCPHSADSYVKALRT